MNSASTPRLTKKKNDHFSLTLGIHSTRIPLIDLALFDVVGTIVAAKLLSYPLRTSFSKLLLVLVIMSFVMHAWFQIDTKGMEYVKIIAKKINFCL